ncbi:YopX family protein [Listeria booriae]|uniref:YopX family protein n=1 Tax=Listeria booriae TaxID=1552123 RepID=UPI0016258CC0|nr:YopX family protein [Listeria booriae]MBC2188695.1 DNA-packaging protein [Listeria booriae]
MSREIKFRVRDKIQNRYITNDLADLCLDLQSGNVLRGDLGRDDSIANVSVRVLLEQYTGLHDKNSNKIFEGDIGWDEHNECYGVVVFDEGKFLYEWENISEDLWEIKGDIEIRGNIHDNPELLGGAAE